MGAGQSTQTGSTPPSRALHVLRVTPSSPASRTNIEPFFDFVVGYDPGDASSANVGSGAKKGMGMSGGSIDAAELEKIVERHEGRRLNLLVWSSKNQDTRGAFNFLLGSVLNSCKGESCISGANSHDVSTTAIVYETVVPITPSREWTLPTSPPPTSSNTGPRHPIPPQFQPQPSKSNPQPQPSLLGLSMRMCEPEFAIDNVWHVLDVLEGSPAESAGLVPYGDWVLGWSGGVLSAESDFYDVVEAVSTVIFWFSLMVCSADERGYGMKHIDKPLRVYVYSYDFEYVCLHGLTFLRCQNTDGYSYTQLSTIREVVLVPNRQWGGEGLLGCVFGFVYHLIPLLSCIQSFDHNCHARTTTVNFRVRSL